ncbi:hypothetical protein EPA93_02995 [Ktedonosporobacter rubrisoli]|uniref:Uncharacterized protein n=1 Tax=Ktedonosporobacter rubrisoli TaxID=2509675 RepID=A0A4P6JIV2_KTERU|nr:hypothetical protein [Ktedonosporobacter rubrisoli]QBD75014.1 hypothetical protein EPA93_02995 [Ktedonosporobacter rubrisoli]
MGKDDRILDAPAQQQADERARKQEPQLSQVAQLRAQIEAELTAMQQGLTGLASGTARHHIISAKLRRVDHLTGELAHHVGEKVATDMSCQAYVRVFDAEQAEEPRHE